MPATKIKMRLFKREKKWWVGNMPLNDVPEMGPYDCRADAEEDRDAMLNLFTRRPEYSNIGDE